MSILGNTKIRRVFYLYNMACMSRIVEHGKLSVEKIAGCLGLSIEDVKELSEE